MGHVWLLLALLVLTEAFVAIALRRSTVFAYSPWRRRIGTALALVATPLIVLAVFVRVAPLESPRTRGELPGVVFLDAHGVVLQRDTSEGLRIPVALEQVAPIMIDATIATEDQRFRNHPGIDPIAMARSVVNLPFERSGASTLSQQLARRLYIEDGTPLIERKAREALLALQLEARYAKDEILSLYLNEVYYGRGAYGVEAAARVYFGTSAANLDLAQASLLAGLPQRPVEYGESLESPAVTERRRYVLDRLVAGGEITREQASRALTEAVDSRLPPSDVIAPHFVQYVRDELEKVLPGANLDGFAIETTLDAGLQAEAQRQVEFQLAQLEEKSVHNAAVVVLEPATGRVLAMVGNADFGDAEAAGQINMALQARQPGSALKPFLYATAFERGFTAASMLLDVPSVFDTKSGPYEPLNYDRRFHGPVPLRVALASSLNVPAVRMLDEIGVEALLETAHRFGLNTLTDAEVYGLALTLGGGEVRLLDLTNAYAAIANGGQLTQPYVIERVRDAEGNVVYEHGQETPRRVLSEENAYLLADILADAGAREVGFGFAPTLRLPFTAAVKTGTTTEFRDNWTLGFTPERVVGVWVGNADNTAMNNISGIDGAGPIWNGVMQAANDGLSPSWPEPPPSLRRVPVCVPAGLLPGPACPSTALEWFVPGTEPRETEDYYARSPDGLLRVDPPAEARAWAMSAGLELVQDGVGGGSTFIVQPANGAVLYMAPELASRTALLRASPPSGTQSIEFRIDGSLVATAPANDPVAVWNLTPGAHVLEVRAVLAGGGSEVATTAFEVRG